MMVNLPLVTYVHEELENIRSALLDTGVPHLARVEKLLREPTCRLGDWLSVAVTAAGDAEDPDAGVAANPADIPY